MSKPLESALLAVARMKGGDMEPMSPWLRELRALRQPEGTTADDPPLRQPTSEFDA